MADYTAGALTSYKKTRAPGWINERGDPPEWEFRILEPLRPILRTTVGDFIERYGSRETSDRMYAALGMNERRIRSLVRAILSEGRDDIPRFIEEDGKLILPGWTL